jgi:hypothetical protein
MASESKGKIDLKIVLRDENEELIYLNQKKSYSSLIVINRETGVLAHWGPRPKATNLIDI